MFRPNNIVRLPAAGTEPVLWKPTLHQRYVLKDFTTLPQRPGHGLLVPADERNKVWLMSTVSKLVRTEPDKENPEVMVEFGFEAREVFKDQDRTCVLYFKYVFITKTQVNSWILQKFRKFELKMTKNMIFLTFRVNKRPTNVSADDWFVKCYENGMNHRLNRLLNPTFNNKNMEVRYCFLASFRLKLTKNSLFFADMYIFLSFPGLRQLSRRWKSSRNLTVTDLQTKYCGASRYVKNTTSKTQKHVVYSQNLKPLLIHIYFVHRDAKNCGMGPGPWLRTRVRKTSNGHMEGATTTPPKTKAKQPTQNEA